MNLIGSPLNLFFEKKKKMEKVVGKNGRNEKIILVCYLYSINIYYY